MLCTECQKYKGLYLCLSCGKILEPVSVNIQKYYTALEKSVNLPENT